MPLPILYSLRNCPYAMRARIAIYKSQQPVILRDIVLSNKPQAMLEASPKGTVPVLVLPSAPTTGSAPEVIEESADIMWWALTKSDPDNLLLRADDNAIAQIRQLIATFDQEFKGKLEQYRCAKRYKEPNVIEHRHSCELHIQDLEQRLSRHQFLLADQESLADIAILPFIRQFARVERQWYLQAPYPNVRKWLNNYLQSKMFSKVMTKHPLWLDTQATVLFGQD